MSFLNGLRRTFGLSTVPRQPSEYDLMKQREAQSMAEAQAVSAHAQNTLDHGAFNGERMPLQQRLQTPAQENYGNEGRGVPAPVSSPPHVQSAPAAPQIANGPQVSRSATGQLQVASGAGSAGSFSPKIRPAVSNYAPQLGETPPVSFSQVAADNVGKDAAARQDSVDALQHARQINSEATANLGRQVSQLPYSFPRPPREFADGGEIDPLYEIRKQVHQKRGY